MAAEEVLIRIRADGSNAQNEFQRTARTLRDVQGAADEVDDSLTQVGNNSGLTDAAQSASGLDSALNDASSASSNLHGTFEKLRNGGAVMAGIGAAGLAMAESFIQAAEEGNALQARLESILKTQQRINDLPAIEAAVQDVTVRGHFESSGDIKNSAALLATMGVETEHLIAILPRVSAIARSVGEDQEEMADTIGEAYRQIDLGGLEEAKLYFNETDIAAVEAAKSISEVAGRAKFMEIMLREADSKAGALEDSLTASAAAANDASRRVGDMTTALGTGAANAKGALTNGVLIPLLDIASASPEVAEGLGFVGYGASAAAATIGGGIGIAGQVGMAITGLNTLGIVGPVNLAAVRTAALGTAAAVGSIAAALGLAALAAGGFWLAYKGSQDASRMSDEDLSAKYGKLGDWWNFAGNGIANAVTGGDGSTQEMLDRANAQRKKRGLAPQTMAEFDAGVEPGQSTATPKAETPEQKLQRQLQESKADADKAMSRIQTAAVPSASAAPLNSSQASINPGIFGTTGGMQAASEAKRLAEEQRDLEIGRLEARYDVLINRLENQKKPNADNTALELEIAEMKRNREVEIAHERSAGDTSSADFLKTILRTDADFRIARDNAEAGRFNDLGKAGSQGSVNPIFQSLAFLKGGGSFSGLAQMDGKSASTGTPTSGGVRTFTAEHIQTRTPTGQVRIDFKPIIIEDALDLHWGGLNR